MIDGVRIGTMDVDPMNTGRADTDRTAEAEEAEATATVVDADADDTADAGDTVDASATEDASDAADDAPDVEPLTITLPDGSESISEAILSHRQMLTTPSEHGLVSAEEGEEILDAVEALSAAVPEELDEELTALERSVEGMVDRMDRQEQRIEELQGTVESLAEILGTSVEFDHSDADE